jgi:hypothetical protein
MRLGANANKRLVLIISVILAIFSTGAVIVQQCHEVKIVSTTAAIHSHEPVNTSQAPHVAESEKISSFAENLIDGACGALFIIVLLFGRKFLLQIRLLSSTFKSKISKSDKGLDWISQIFTVALSRSQLGIIRI